MPRSIATLLVALASAAVVLLVAEGAAAAAPDRAWQLPVAGATAARGFDPERDPFEAGRHRGLDLTGAAGSRVRAPCPGRVTFAGPVARQGGVVTVHCGPWLMSALPLRAVAVRGGAVVARGQRLGRLADHPGHTGLHVGVRRAGSGRSYVDPAPFFGRGRAPLPPVAGPVRRGRPRARGPLPRLGPAPAPAPAQRQAPVPRGEPRLAPARPALLGPAASRRPALPLAPWPAWAGLALVLVAAAGGAALRGASRRGEAVRTPERRDCTLSPYAVQRAGASARDPAARPP